MPGQTPGEGPFPKTTKNPGVCMDLSKSESSNVLNSQPTHSTVCTVQEVWQFLGFINGFVPDTPILHDPYTTMRLVAQFHCGQKVALGA